MKVIVTAVIAVVVVMGAAVLFDRPDTAEDSPAKVASARTQTASRHGAIAAEVQSGKAKLLDVRTPEEYTAGHFPGASNVPVQDVAAGSLPRTPKDTPVYVYCRSGNRSAEAARLLQMAGYTAVTDLGGLESVKALGGKLTAEGGTL